MTKALIVTSEFPPQSGGIGNHAFNLAVQLSNNGYDVTVITDNRSLNGEIEIEFDVKQKFNIVRVKRHKLLIYTYFNRVIHFLKCVKNIKPSFVLASGKSPLWLVGFSPNKLGFKKAAIIHGSEVNLKSFLPRKMVDYSLMKFDDIIAVSNYTKSLVNHLRLKNITVIPNGVAIKDSTDEIYINSTIGSPMLITVGSITRRKGQHNVIKALPKLIKEYPSIHYHIIGIPTEKKNIFDLVHSLSLNEYVTVHGEVSQEKLISILKCSDVFVMLSEQTMTGDLEGFGIALLEANFFGIPTIGSKKCGIEDAIDNYKSGILINHDNSLEFKEALVEIMYNKKRYRENAVSWAKAHSWDNIIGKYLKVLN
jgi:phosphatidylinositol alpha-1,6-mannosyltransferase